MSRRKTENLPATTDPNVEAASQIYAVAQEQANQKLQELQGQVEHIRQETFAQGTIRALEAVTAFNELMKYTALFRIKQFKEYRKDGLTWDEFCESLGLERRTVDRTLEDISPLVSEFSDKMHMISNIPFNKIRHLGRQISGQLSEIQDGVLIYGDERIPLSPEYADDIQALIEKIDEEKKAAADEAQADIRAKDRVLKSKDEVIKKQEKELTRLERKARAKELSPEEDAILDRIENLSVELNGHVLAIENVLDALRENPFSNAIAAFMTSLDNVRMRVSTFREVVAAELAPAGMVDDGWMPPGVELQK